MRTRTHVLFLFTAGALLLGTNAAQAGRRAYGVSNDRGSAVATPRGVAWSGENSSGAVTRRGGAVATDNGVAVAKRPYPTTLPAPVPSRVVVAPLPAGYIRVVPAGYRTVYYGGYNCRFVGGVYYRPVMYQGSTVYVVVR